MRSQDAPITLALSQRGSMCIGITWREKERSMGGVREIEGGPGGEQC